MGKRAIDLLARTCTVLGALAIAIMMLSTCWDIVARMVANAPLKGVVELVEIMVLASAMLGLPETFLRDEQITVDLIDSILPRRVVTFIKGIALILTIILMGILAINIYQPMLDAHRFGDIKYDLGVPLYPLYGLIIVAFALSILSCVAVLTRKLLSPGN